MIKIFRGGGGGVGWGGISVKDASSGGGGGSLRDLSKKILKLGVGKGNSCSKGGEGFEGVTTPASPENFNHIQIPFPMIYSLLGSVSSFENYR